MLADSLGSVNLVVSQGDRSKKRVLAIQHKNQLWHALDILTTEKRKLAHNRRAIPDYLVERIDAVKVSYSHARRECDTYRA